MPRKFKPGDWVKVKGKLTAPKMQVMNYVHKNTLVGTSINDQYLECVYYKNSRRQSEVFHQNKLVKMRETGGLFRTFPIYQENLFTT